AVIVSGATPPVGTSNVSLGRTARHALTATGGSSSPGNIFSPSAPAASAAKASVGVATPGKAISPRALAAAITGAVQLGAMISLAPVAATASTSASISTVPA